VNRPRPIAVAGIAAALLCNYWVLESVLADRFDLESSWISDLASRSESSGWRFVALGIVAGLGIAVFAALLLRTLPVEGSDRPILGRFSSRRLLRGGLLALLASGLFAVIASAAPLDCAEGLEPTCSLSYDPLDVVHSLATGGEIAATVLAFALIGLALLDRGRPLSSPERQTTTTPRVAGYMTLILGLIWLLLTILTGVTYLGDGVDSVKGLFQRTDQVVFGIWLVLLGLWARGGKLRPV
jgi:hypothetical protein